MSYNFPYQPVNEVPRLGNVKQNNPLNPFSSNTTNPQQWGTTPEQLKSTRDFIEMVSFSLFFSGVYWTVCFVVCLVKGYLGGSSTSLIALLLVGSLVGAASLSYRQCSLWYEYGALEYWQPVKDLFRFAIKRKGLRSLSAGILLFLLCLVYGPLLVGAVAWVDELGQREHRD